MLQPSCQCSVSEVLVLQHGSLVVRSPPRARGRVRRHRRLSRIRGRWSCFVYRCGRRRFLGWGVCGVASCCVGLSLCCGWLVCCVSLIDAILLGLFGGLVARRRPVLIMSRNILRCVHWSCSSSCVVKALKLFCLSVCLSVCLPACLPAGLLQSLSVLELSLSSVGGMRL